MKKALIILVTLGLVSTVCAMAGAVDVKFSGEYYAAGMYLDKTTLKKDSLDGTDGPSTAFYYQRLRLTTTFVVSKGLTLTTRADIMERAWGAARSVPGTALDRQSMGTRAENENIAFDYLYLTYASPVGVFLTGIHTGGNWGTVFGDNSVQFGKVRYAVRLGDFSLGIQTCKAVELSRTAINATTAVDRDNTQYDAWAIYIWKTGQAGLLFKYIRNAGNRDLPAPYPGDAGFLAHTYVVSPYVKAKLGPVSIQSEILYTFGQARKWEGSAPYDTLADTRIDQIAGWVDAVVDMGMFYAGGTVAYVQGDDPGTGALEGGILTGGYDWNPCLILFNSDMAYWAGTQPGYNATAAYGANAGRMTNVWFFQGRGGVRPVDALDITASVSYATADKKPTAAWAHNDYGVEIDLQATYKITNNLSYMLGAGYLFTGKYFSGTDVNALGLENKVTNNFLVMNKLTLTF